MSVGYVPWIELVNEFGLSDLSLLEPNQYTTRYWTVWTDKFGNGESDEHSDQEIAAKFALSLIRRDPTILSAEAYREYWERENGTIRQLGPNRTIVHYVRDIGGDVHEVTDIQ